ncbi:glutamyl endopeptidase [Paraphaeosphaeria minitans]|uniref:Serine protease n=1 Tax=Paraphaeosphaeria minitans TaxID=565426 RepID=A0A9P6GVB9_9PLEO|nr:glutamyl endopeptidase [Paraphaeosphaeria minitans]
MDTPTEPQATTPAVPVAEEPTTPEVAVTGETTTPAVPVAGETTTPAVPVAGETTTPAVPVAGETTTPAVPVAGETTTPATPMTEQPVTSMQKPHQVLQERMGKTSLDVIDFTNKATETVVIHWDLLKKFGQVKESATLKKIIRKNGSKESVISEFPDVTRTPVDVTDIQDKHGKYRAIVKLFLRYQNSGKEEWSIGTGWLISEDRVVTAGHCAFNSDPNGGPLAEAKVYIGYRGRKALTAPGVEMRTVTSVVTTSEFVGGQRQRDMAIMELNEPFNDVIPLSYQSTPASGIAKLGVVGFPGDILGDDKEPGGRMYEMFLDTPWDLGTAGYNMLEYKIDTFGGNSGSPVLISTNDGKYAAIGIHTYGGMPNSATVLGYYGVPLPPYLLAFNSRSAEVREDPLYPNGEYRTVKIPSDYPSGPMPKVEKPAQTGAGTTTTTTTTTVSKESFPVASTTSPEFINVGDIFKTVKGVVDKIGPQILSTAVTALPSLGGPVGSVMGAVANMAISAIADGLEERKESWNPSETLAGTPERAIMEQATLDALISISKQKGQEALVDEILSKMEPIVQQSQQQFESLASVASPLLQDYTIRVALDALGRKSSPNDFPTTVTVDPAPPSTKESLTEAVVLSNAIIQHSTSLSSESGKEEGLNLVDIIKRAGHFAKGAAYSGALSATATAVVQHANKKRQLAGLPTFKMGDELNSAFAKQAMLGHAAYQAVMTMDQTKLAEAKFYDLMVLLAKKTAVQVITAYPGIQTDLPTYLNRLLDETKKESGNIGQTPVPILPGEPKKPIDLQSALSDWD